VIWLHKIQFLTGSYTQKGVTSRNQWHHDYSCWEHALLKINPYEILNNYVDMTQSEIICFIGSKTGGGGLTYPFIHTTSIWLPIAQQSDCENNNRDFTVLYPSSTDIFRKLKFLYYLIINKGLSSDLMWLQSVQVDSILWIMT
jgi:hypothetical protein